MDRIKYPIRKFKRIVLTKRSENCKLHGVKFLQTILDISNEKMCRRNFAKGKVFTHSEIGELLQSEKREVLE